MHHTNEKKKDENCFHKNNNLHRALQPPLNVLSLLWLRSNLRRWLRNAHRSKPQTSICSVPLPARFHLHRLYARTEHSTDVFFLPGVVEAAAASAGSQIDHDNELIPQRETTAWHVMRFGIWFSLSRTLQVHSFVRSLVDSRAL